MKRIIYIMFIHPRQQKLITMLLQDQEWHTLEEISNELKCAEKTVRRDLLCMKDSLPPEWKIHVTKGRGIKLYKPPHSSSTSIYSVFKKNDMIFQVLNQLLLGNVRTVVGLADALYVNVATLSAVLRKVQQYLAPFKLQLKKNPLRLVGIEPHIVYMFYELYFNTYVWDEWPFSNQTDIFRYVAEIEQKLDIQFYPTYKQRLAYLLAISIQRKKQGHQMDILPIYEDLAIETSFYQKIRTLSPILCGFPLTKMDQIVISVAVNCFMFIPSDKSNYKQEILAGFYEEKSTTYRYAKNLVRLLEKEFNMLFSQDTEFIFCLLQYIKQISYRYQFIPGVTLPLSEGHDNVKRKHAQTFQKVKEIYTHWVQQHPLIPYVYEEDIKVITLQLEATFQLKQSYQKKALLYLGDSVLWRRYLLGVLYNEFGHTLAISHEEVLDIHTCDIQKLDVDCILTTVPISEMPLPIIQISVVPTRRELDDIKKLLHEKSNN